MKHESTAGFMSRCAGWLAAGWLALLTGNASANSIRVSNVRLQGQNTDARTMNVVFDLAWSNSWRGADNWGNTNNMGTNSVGVFNTGVTGLTAGTNYYYRCYGTNAYGEGWSATAPFTTQFELTNRNGGSYDGYDSRYRQTVGYHMGTMFSTY